MSKIQQNKQTNIPDLMRTRYNTKHKTLRLNFTPKQWQQVLLYDDWKTDDWKTIYQLYLECCCITSQCMRVVSDVNWSNLKRLYLSRNQIGAKGAQYISKMNLCLLQCLQINDNKLGDTGISHLYKVNWANLSSISIYNNKITLDAYNTNNLTNSKRLKQLITNKHCFGLMQTDPSHPISALALITNPSQNICINTIIDNEYLRLRVAHILKIRRKT